MRGWGVEVGLPTLFLKEIVNLETFLKTFQKVVDIFRIILYTNFCRETRDHSSAGRASALQAEGHRFEPYWSHSLCGMHKDMAM